MTDMVNILKKAVEKRASDIHLVIGSPPVLRINGEMTPLSGYKPLDAETTKALIYSVLLNSQTTKFEQNWELDCSFGIDGARFRINVFNSTKGVEAVMRIVPSSIPSPQEIGLPPEIIRLADLSKGLVLVTGPTGSGKSTTLAALLEVKNQKEKANIITIEDPIEFTYQDKMSVFRQREVGQQTKSFANALRASLRQDPDVILVGEMRDLETIQLALTAAETGHLCFATLHTQDAPSTIDRIIDVFPPHQQTQIRVQLAATLRAVISQTLLPRADGAGRIAARELMMVTSAIANLIREAKSHMLHNAIDTGSQYGMISMDKALANLVNEGHVSFEAVENKVRSPESFEHFLKGGRKSRAIDY